MVAGDVISMPDKWEYPWFAAWDLAFHCAPLSLVDVDFAKEQVELLLSTRYLHPNGQIPAYEWNFSDVNPPVHRVGGAVRLRARGRDPRRGRPRVPGARVRAAADQLHLVGQPQGPRRPQPLPGRLPRPRQHRHLRPLGAAARRRHARAGRRHGVDGALLPVDAADRASSWRAHDPAYADMALKFVTHFVWIAIALEPARRRHGAVGRGGRLLLRRDAHARRQRRSSSRCARSSGLLPLCAATVFDARRARAQSRADGARRRRSSTHFSDAVPALAHLPGPSPEGRRHRSSLVDEQRLRRILAIMLDEDEFLGPHGIRAISRRHLDAAVRVRLGRAGATASRYLPGRVRHRHVRRQLELARAGLVPDEPRHPARAAAAAPLLRRPAQGRVPDRLGPRAEPARGRRARSAARLATTFTEDEHGRRPVFGGIEKFQTDPHWHDLLLFHEYFHGDNGAGIGASHQTGWTGHRGAAVPARPTRCAPRPGAAAGVAG